MRRRPISQRPVRSRMRSRIVLAGFRVALITGEDRVLFRCKHRSGEIQVNPKQSVDQSQAAGFVVRRLTMTKARPNIKSENRISVANDAENANCVGLSG